MNLLGITFLSLVFILLTEFNIILVLFIFLYDDPLEKMLLILFLEMLFPKGITIFLKIFSSIFPDISRFFLSLIGEQEIEEEISSVPFLIIPSASKFVFSLHFIALSSIGLFFIRHFELFKYSIYSLEFKSAIDECPLLICLLSRR